jgi:general secretion pathway protein G
MSSEKPIPLDYATRKNPAFRILKIVLGLAALSCVIFEAVVLLAPERGTFRPKIASAQSDIAIIRIALSGFKLDDDRYPTTAEGLNALIAKPPGTAGPAADWPFLEKIPNDPWGHPYIYRCPSTDPKKDYDLLSAGPDGKEGTADDFYGE